MWTDFGLGSRKLRFSALYNITSKNISHFRTDRKYTIQLWSNSIPLKIPRFYFEEALEIVSHWRCKNILWDRYLKCSSGALPETSCFTKYQKLQSKNQFTRWLRYIILFSIYVIILGILPIVLLFIYAFVFF